MNTTVLDPLRIPPSVLSLGRLIVKCQIEHEPVRIPALSGLEWGYLLCALDIITSSTPSIKTHPE